MTEARWEPPLDAGELPLRPYASLVLLPLLGAAHSFGFYLAQAMKWQLALSGGATLVALQPWAVGQAAAGLLAAGGAGALCGLLGPRIVAALGAACSAAGVAMWLVPGADLLGLGGVVLAVGRSAVSVGLLAAAFDAFPTRMASLRIVTVALILAAVNLGAAATLVPTAILGAVPPGAVAATLPFLLVPMVLAGLVLIRTPDDATDRTRRFHAGSVGVAALSFAVLAPAQFVYWLGATGIDLLEQPWRFTLNPMVFGVVGVLVAVGAAALHGAGRRAPPLAGASAGLVLGGAGLALVSLGGAGALVAGVVLASMGEALLSTFALVAVADDVHWRLAPILIGGSLAIVRLPGFPVWTFAGDVPLWGYGAACGVGAVVCGALAVPLARWSRRQDDSRPAHEAVVGGGERAEVQDP